MSWPKRLKNTDSAVSIAARESAGSRPSPASTLVACGSRLTPTPTALICGADSKTRQGMWFWCKASASVRPPRPPPTTRTSFAAFIRLSDPVARVAEHAHPRRVFARAVGRPGHLDVAEYALRVRHDDGEAPVRSGEAGDALRRAAGVVWIGFGDAAAVVDVPHRDQGLLQIFFLVENGPAFAVRGHDRDAAARHALEEKRRAVGDLDHYQPPLELLGAIAHEARPMRRPRDQLLQRGHHLAGAAGTQLQAVAARRACLEFRADFRVEQDRARPAAAAAEHVAIREAAARDEAPEARQRAAPGDHIRHVDVDRFESGAIERRRHLDLAVYALLAKNRNPGPCF